jgi:threonine aldolase
MAADHLKVINMKSDTVTTPTQGMKQAMMEAEVGDDVFGDDPTVIRLQEKLAAMLNKESSLFFPSGTMSNLTAIMAHANERGDEIILGDKSHIAVNEQGGISNLGGVFSRQVMNLPDGTLDLDEVAMKIQHGGYASETRTKAIAVENTHNNCNGAPLPLQWMDELAAIAREHDLKVHVDGARIFNAAAALDQPPSVLVQHADSVSVCLSKGLGAQIGTLLAGSKDLIKRCHQIRKCLGGGMRQVGVIAAAGIVALDSMPQLLRVDHENAHKLALGLSEFDNISINVDRVHTNLVFFHINRDDVTSDMFCNLMEDPSDDGVVAKFMRFDKKYVRAVTHHQVSSDDIDLVLNKVEQVLKQL